MRTHRLHLLVGLGLVAGLVALAPATAAFAAPALGVSPNTGLVDGQEVSVTGSGFTPGATIGMAECVTGATDQSGCATATITTTSAGPTGGFTATVTVRRLVSTAGGVVDCAGVGACTIGAANLADFGEAATAPIAFDPNVPPPPPLKFRVDIDRTDNVRPAVGTVRIAGTVTCNQPVDVSVDLLLVQLFHRNIFYSYAFTSVACTRSSRFAVTLRPVNGLFGTGAAKVRFDAFGSASTSYEVMRTVDIDLVVRS